VRASRARIIEQVWREVHTLVVEPIAAFTWGYRLALSHESTGLDRWVVSSW
jgi:hypothetical protein